MLFRYGVIFCLCFFRTGYTQAQLPSDMHNLAISSISCVYNEKFKEAKNYAKRIIKNYSNHPAGYFFYAAILNSQMEYLQSEEYEAEFYQYCDNAITKGEELQEKEPDDVWVKFIIAGANGLKGTYESRYKRWLTAFKHGWRGVVLLKEVLETNAKVIDAQYGIATYDYWRSAKTKMLWWLPGVEDKRKPAIKILYEVLDKATYVRENTALNLIDMLLNEKRYDEALQVANKLLSQYPTSLVIMWRKAEAQLGLRVLEEAEITYKSILKRVEAGSFESNYNITVCHYFLSKVYLYQKKYKQCLDAIEAMESFKLSSVSKKRLEDIYDDAATAKKIAQKKL